MSKYTITRFEHGGNKRCTTENKRAFMWVRTECPDGKELTCLYVYEPGNGWIWQNGWDVFSMGTELESAWQKAHRTDDSFCNRLEKLLSKLFTSYADVIEIEL